MQRISTSVIFHIMFPKSHDNPVVQYKHYIYSTEASILSLLRGPPTPPHSYIPHFIVFLLSFLSICWGPRYQYRIGLGTQKSTIQLYICNLIFVHKYRYILPPLGPPSPPHDYIWVWIPFWFICLSLLSVCWGPRYRSNCQFMIKTVILQSNNTMYG